MPQDFKMKRPDKKEEKIKDKEGGRRKMAVCSRQEERSFELAVLVEEG